jgi:acetoin utilization protein AcuB
MMGIRWIGAEAVPLRIKTKSQLGLGHVSGALPISPADRDSHANQKVVSNTYSRQSQAQQNQNRPPEKLIVAHQIMSSPAHSIGPEASLEIAWKKMSFHKFRHLPVVDDRAQLIGMLSDRDVLPFLHDLESKKLKKELLVSSVMNRSLIIASLDTPVRELADTMVHEGVGCVPICDTLNNNRLVGIVSAVDILRGLVNHAPMEMWG